MTNVIPIRRRYTAALVRGLLAEKGITLNADFAPDFAMRLADTYAYQCSQGHTWRVTLQAALQCQGCPFCSGYVSPLTTAVRVQLLSMGFTLLGEHRERIVLKHHYTFKCPFKHTFSAELKTVLSACRCPTCAFERTTSRNQGSRTPPPVTLPPPPWS